MLPTHNTKPYTTSHSFATFHSLALFNSVFRLCSKLVVLSPENVKITEFGETFSSFHVRQFHTHTPREREFDRMTRMHLSCMLHADDIIIFVLKLSAIRTSECARTGTGGGRGLSTEDISKFATFGNEHFNFITKLKSVNLKALYPDVRLLCVCVSTCAYKLCIFG